MYEYTIKNNMTNEIDYIFGYNENDAWRRTTLNEAEWTVIGCEYAD